MVKLEARRRAKERIEKRRRAQEMAQKKKKRMEEVSRCLSSSVDGAFVRYGEEGFLKKIAPDVKQDWDGRMDSVFSLIRRILPMFHPDRCRGKSEMLIIRDAMIFQVVVNIRQYFKKLKKQGINTY